MGITGMIGPSLFTRIFANFISTHRSWQLPGAPFLLAALLLVAAFATAWRVTRT
jgi:DHA1 family tetracycline resistance protein-like MFS transporter